MRSAEEAANTKMRRRALLALGLTVAIAIAAWIGLSRAADYGVSRVIRMEAARVPCDSAWAHALSREDTLSVDRKPLRDTIDAGTGAPLSRCGSLRASR